MSVRIGTATPLPLHMSSVEAGLLPIIVVLATGGTIAQAGSRVATLGVADLLAAVPGIERVASLRCEQVFQVASPEITEAHWLTLAQRLNAVLSQGAVTGAIVTHGTDTLEETAYFLNLVIKHDKPVVVVGAMRPSDAASADGPANLRNAVAIAASPQARGQGVLVTLNDRIEAAREVTKTNTSALEAFRSPDLGPLGQMQDGLPVFYRQSLRRHTRDTDLDISGISELPKVGIVYGYAGVDGTALDAFAAAGVKGLVYAGTGNGSVPTHLQPRLAELRAAGIVVVRSSRVNGGTVTRNTEVDDDRLDLVTADTLNPQKARVLLMLALCHTSSSSAIRRMFDEY